MAASLRSLGSALRVASSQTNMGGKRFLNTRQEVWSYKEKMANCVRQYWSSLSQENRTMMKQSFINLTVPAVYSGFIWLVSAGADMVKETLLNKGTVDDETASLPDEVQSSKKKFDQKLDQLVEALDMVKEERESLKSEILRLKGEILEKDEELKMLRELLASQMGQMGIIWMKCFAKNLNNASLLSFYDLPEATGMVYWNQN